MKIRSIIDKLEEVKSNIWEHVDDEKTNLQIEIKNQTNYLLDLLDELIDEEGEI